MDISATPNFVPLAVSPPRRELVPVESPRPADLPSPAATAPRTGQTTASAPDLSSAATSSLPSPLQSPVPPGPGEALQQVFANRNQAAALTAAPPPVTPPTVSAAPSADVPALPPAPDNAVTDFQALPTDDALAINQTAQRGDALGALPSAPDLQQAQDLARNLSVTPAEDRQAPAPDTLAETINQQRGQELLNRLSDAAAVSPATPTIDTLA